MANHRPIKKVDSKKKTEYERLVKNAKSKMRNIKKNFGERVTVLEESSNGELTPVTKRVEDLVNIPKLSDLNTWDQFHDTVEKLSSFTNRNNTKFQFKKNQHDVVASKNLLNKAEMLKNRAERIAKKERAKTENKEVLGAEGATVGERARMVARPNKLGYAPITFNFNDLRNVDRLKDKFNSLENKSNPHYFDRRKKQFQENWLDSLAGSFNSAADELLDKMKQLNPDDFYELYQILERYMDIDLYDSEGQMVSANEDTLRKLEHHIDSFLSGNISLDMKSFRTKEEGVIGKVVKLWEEKNLVVILKQPPK
jgi:hypothetical protein